ncbi:MAG: hypothetical protein PWR01_1266 [Clostridiales bacterium]|nr:hypothetical protein [Clostridiales bacterium]
MPKFHFSGNKGSFSKNIISSRWAASPSARMAAFATTIPPALVTSRSTVCTDLRCLNVRLLFKQKRNCTGYYTETVMVYTKFLVKR